MTIFRFGYVAMSMNLQNASPSKTMTFKQFSSIADREAAIRKLERIAKENFHNCLRLLRHNAIYDIHFFRFSSRLIPLVNHPELTDWNYRAVLKEALLPIKQFLSEHPEMRVDFHPDHFVLLNTKDKQVFQVSLETLQMHYHLLKGMGIVPRHRCVLHVGGAYNDKEQALEQFIHNWSLIPSRLQEMVILENDDKIFSAKDTLYLCEKLGVPLVFDYHHYLANHEEGESLKEDWERIVQTWHQNSDLPVKIHISSPKSEKDFRAHSDTIDLEMLWGFIEAVNGSTNQIDVMIEAKWKDKALFLLMDEIKIKKQVDWVNETSFRLL